MRCGLNDYDVYTVEISAKEVRTLIENHLKTKAFTLPSKWALQISFDEYHITLGNKDELSRICTTGCTKRNEGEVFDLSQTKPTNLEGV